jgi:hypothetical protein
VRRSGKPEHVRAPEEKAAPTVADICKNASRPAGRRVRLFAARR